MASGDQSNLSNGELVVCGWGSLVCLLWRFSSVNWPWESPGVHPLRMVRFRRSQN